MTNISPSEFSTPAATPSGEEPVPYEETQYFQVASQIEGMFPEVCEVSQCGEVASQADMLACEVEYGTMTLDEALDAATEAVAELIAKCPKGPIDGKCGQAAMTLCGAVDKP